MAQRAELTKQDELLERVRAARDGHRAGKHTAGKAASRAQATADALGEYATLLSSESSDAFIKVSVPAPHTAPLLRALLAASTRESERVTGPPASQHPPSLACDAHPPPLPASQPSRVCLSCVRSFSRTTRRRPIRSATC